MYFISMLFICEWHFMYNFYFLLLYFDNAQEFPNTCSRTICTTDKATWIIHSFLSNNDSIHIATTPICPLQSTLLYQFDSLYFFLFHIFHRKFFLTSTRWTSLSFKSVWKKEWVFFRTWTNLTRDVVACTFIMIIIIIYYYLFFS